MYLGRHLLGMILAIAGGVPAGSHQGEVRPTLGVGAHGRRRGMRPATMHESCQCSALTPRATLVTPQETCQEGRRVPGI
jgi:hypothetical protein